MKVSEFKSYDDFLDNFVRAGYEFKRFDNFVEGKDRQVILRHDIDFDPYLAYVMNMNEFQRKIEATYFIMISNYFYNTVNIGIHNNILGSFIGCDIGLHFDPRNYPKISFENALDIEQDIFMDLYGFKFDIISIHRPSFNSIFKGNDEVKCTYADKWFKNIKYISDSRGIFREGNPFESDWFKAGRSVQCLIHPIWWLVRGNDAVEKINNWLGVHNNHLLNVIADSCEPYKEYLMKG